MRILFAHGEKIEKTEYSQFIGKYGTVDFFDNGRDALLSFVNCFQAGNRYDLLVINHDLKQLDGVETVLMIRKYELEHLASYKKTLIVFCSRNQHCRSSYEVRHGVDERTIFQNDPVSISTLEYFAENIAVERSLKTLPGIARYGRPVNTFA
jgi:hypothetical protein